MAPNPSYLPRLIYDYLSTKGYSSLANQFAEECPYLTGLKYFAETTGIKKLPPMVGPSIEEIVCKYIQSKDRLTGPSNENTVKTPTECSKATDSSAVKDHDYVMNSLNLDENVTTKLSSNTSILQNEKHDQREEPVSSESKKGEQSNQILHGPSVSNVPANIVKSPENNNVSTTLPVVAPLLGHNTVFIPLSVQSSELQKAAVKLPSQGTQTTIPTRGLKVNSPNDMLQTPLLTQAVVMNATCVSLQNTSDPPLNSQTASAIQTNLQIFKLPEIENTPKSQPPSSVTLVARFPKDSNTRLLFRNENGQLRLLGTFPGIKGPPAGAGTSNPSVRRFHAQQQSKKSRTAQLATQIQSSFTQSNVQPVSSPINSNSVVVSNKITTCTDFLSRLWNIVATLPPSVSSNVRKLMQDLVKGRIESEDFRSRFQDLLKPLLSPECSQFLKDHMTALREFLSAQLATGVGPGLAKVTELAGEQSPNCSPANSASTTQHSSFDVDSAPSTSSATPVANEGRSSPLGYGTSRKEKEEDGPADDDDDTPALVIDLDPDTSESAANPPSGPEKEIASTKEATSLTNNDDSAAQHPADQVDVPIPVVDGDINVSVNTVQSSSLAVKTISLIDSNVDSLESAKPRSNPPPLVRINSTNLGEVFDLTSPTINNASGPLKEGDGTSSAEESILPHEADNPVAQQSKTEATASANDRDDLIEGATPQPDPLADININSPIAESPANPLNLTEPINPSTPDQISPPTLDVEIIDLDVCSPCSVSTKSPPELQVEHQSNVFTDACDMDLIDLESKSPISTNTTITASPRSNYSEDSSYGSFIAKGNGSSHEDVTAHSSTTVVGLDRKKRKVDDLNENENCFVASKRPRLCLRPCSVILRVVYELKIDEQNFTISA